MKNIVNTFLRGMMLPVFVPVVVAIYFVSWLDNNACEWLSSLQHVRDKILAFADRNLPVDRGD